MNEREEGAKEQLPMEEFGEDSIGEESIGEDSELECSIALQSLKDKVEGFTEQMEQQKEEDMIVDDFEAKAVLNDIIVVAEAKDTTAADNKSFKELDAMQGKIGMLLKNLEVAAQQVWWQACDAQSQWFS